MKSGQIYRIFGAKDGTLVTLRAPKWEDLENALEYANQLFQEWQTDPHFGVPLSRKPTLEEEAKWLADSLIKIELGLQISVVAEIDGKLVGNSQVNRPENKVLQHYGKLGISVSKDHRHRGLGKEMMSTLLDECRKVGLKVIELDVFADNPGAIHVYEKMGFKEVGRTPNKINRSGQFVDDLLMVIQL